MTDQRITGLEKRTGKLEISVAEVKKELEFNDKAHVMINDKLDDIQHAIDNGLIEQVTQAIKDNMPKTVNKGFGPKEWTAIIITFITAAGALASAVLGGG